MGCIIQWQFLVRDVHRGETVMLYFEGWGIDQGILNQREGNFQCRSEGGVPELSCDPCPIECNFESIGHVCVWIADSHRKQLRDFIGVLHVSEQAQAK